MSSAPRTHPHSSIYTETNLVSVVAELPLVTQGYRLIDSYGPQGISNMDFCCRHGLSLDPYINRLITKVLIKQSKVFAITMDNTPVRTVRWVASNLYWDKIVVEIEYVTIN